MKAVNVEYDSLFKVLKDRRESRTADNSSADADSSNTDSSYDWENDKALREVLQKIICFDGIEIEIIGQWIWVSGNTYAHKAEPKETGFKWASQKKQWYFRMLTRRKAVRH